MNVLPVFSLFVAFGIALRRRAAWRTAALAAVLALSLVSIGYHAWDPHYDFRHIREVSAYLRENAGERPVIHTAYSTYFSSYFYDRGRLNEYLLTPERLAFFRGGEIIKVCRPGATRLIEDVVKPGDEFYLVLPEWVEYWEADRRSADESLSRYIDNNYQLLERKGFYGAVAYKVRRLS
jgi:hypothetical protein